MNKITEASYRYCGCAFSANHLVIKSGTLATLATLAPVFSEAVTGVFYSAVFDCICFVKKRQKNSPWFGFFSQPLTVLRC